MSERKRLGLAVAAAFAAGGATAGQVTYEEVGAARGITAQYRPGMGMGSGISAADFDDDGDIDLFVPTARGTPNLVYRNRGDGTYEEVAAELGLAGTDHARIGIWFDYDADGRLDLAVLHDLHRISTVEVSSLRLYRQNEKGTFDDVTEAAGLLKQLSPPDFLKHAGGMVAADVSGDGWLDLYACFWSGEAHLFVNNGDGTFTDASAGSGLDKWANHWQPLIFDFDGDGLRDVFSAEDFKPNALWLNQGDGTFKDAAPAAGVATSYNEMGVAAGDYDNDGRLDIYVTNVFELTPGAHNVLFRDVTSGPGLRRYAEVAQQAGVGDTGWGWGTTFFDADNDGWLDLAATNGFTRPQWVDDQSRFFINNGDGTFDDRSERSGFDDRSWGMGLIAFDSNRDGWLDLAQTTNDPDPFVRLLEGRPDPGVDHNWLVVRPRMEGPNTRAIGAVVRVGAGDVHMMRLVTAGASFLSQEPAEAHFGLGRADRAAWVRIEWPDGTFTTRADVAANQILTVTWRRCAADLNGDGVVDFEDFLAFQELFAAGDPAADLDEDGRLTFFDFLELVDLFGRGCG